MVFPLSSSVEREKDCLSLFVAVSYLVRLSVFPLSGTITALTGAASWMSQKSISGTFKFHTSKKMFWLIQV